MKHVQNRKAGGTGPSPRNVGAGCRAADRDLAVRRRRAGRGAAEAADPRSPADVLPAGVRALRVAGRCGGADRHRAAHRAALAREQHRLCGSLRRRAGDAGRAARGRGDAPRARQDEPAGVPPRPARGQRRAAQRRHADARPGALRPAARAAGRGRGASRRQRGRHRRHPPARGSRRACPDGLQGHDAARPSSGRLPVSKMSSFMRQASAIPNDRFARLCSRLAVDSAARGERVRNLAAALFVRHRQVIQEDIFMPSSC